MGGSFTREKIRKNTKNNKSHLGFSKVRTRCPPWYDHITPSLVVSSPIAQFASFRLVQYTPYSPHSHSGVLFPVIIQVAGVAAAAAAVVAAVAVTVACCFRRAGHPHNSVCRCSKPQVIPVACALSIPFGRFGLNSD